MNGGLRRVAVLTRTLLRQNRVLLFLLIVWPCLLSLILWFASSGRPSPEDIRAILQQELFYGLALVGLAASMALGTERRARRVQPVLGWAVGRWEYLLALGAAAYVPFTSYVLVWWTNAGVLARLQHQPASLLWVPALSELPAGLLLCTAGLLASVLLPQIAAATLTGMLLAGCAAAASAGWGGAANVFAAVLGFAPRLSPWACLETFALSAVLLLTACWWFKRADLVQI